ncbi:response regulator transcription factor [Flagellimonas allohymeniacidonis]|uniref:Response regulator n=1 Tax=Flagellimonas allohymeniacidonis TaxID=2517819 RepID=A0A4Q8QAR6_9FLAO|nr:response regulator [Allomuricauda hymeniacidonis]TAI46744.1 response regulator [Allomuricauda hymeniacidonis]
MTKLNSIYIIDDDPITVFGIKKMLKTIVECPNVKTFENGKLALDQIMDELRKGIQPPEVIFLDINMPIMDGWEFLEELLKLDIKEKIIINVVTSSIDTSDYQRWNKFRINCLHYLNYKNKPIFSIEPTDLKRINLAS